MSEGTGTLKSLHRALINLNKRAERSASEILVSNFVDSRAAIRPFINTK